jgi:hypothetical protein
MYASLTTTRRAEPDPVGACVHRDDMAMGPRFVNGGVLCASTQRRRTRILFTMAKPDQS